ncbi:DUF563 domain-containing protein [Synechococcus sp. 1G10]|uniref:glycosyltransferase family 61 protein n=1 Tax=Synechococcus sp. 1G10 TaxID=2025605 RepID=UPI0013033F14|nr:glycosyltransferase family 61 protein [Synechococcus sp. 1G10]
MLNQVPVTSLADDACTRKEEIRGYNESILLTGLKDGLVSVSQLQRMGGPATDYGLRVYANNGNCIEIAGTDYQTSATSSTAEIHRIRQKMHNQPVNGRIGVFFDRWIGNYYHWMLYCLPKIVLLHKFMGVDKFFLPSGLYELPRFAWESVELLGFSNSALLPISCGFHGASELCVVHGASPSPLAWKFTRSQFRHLMVGCNPSKTRSLFLKRKANVHAQRQLVNENEVEQMCINKGIRIVDPGQASVLDQIRLFNEAKLVIALHGAALTNIMWMEPGGKVIEIATDNQPHYLSLAEHFDHEWISLKAKRVDEGANDHNGRFTVDTKMLGELIDSLT